MSREYRHIKMYKKEIFEIKEGGLSQRQIAKKLGITYEKMCNFFKRHNILIDEYIYFYNNKRLQIKTKLTPPEKRSQYVA